MYLRKEFKIIEWNLRVFTGIQQNSGEFNGNLGSLVEFRGFEETFNELNEIYGI